MVDLIDTNGVKPTLKKGVLGYDDYSVGGDAGRLYVGTGTASIAQAKKSEVDSHTSNVSNPHSVTKAQVGLGNVDNTSDVNKPVSTATQTALNTKVDKVTSTDNAIARFDLTSGQIQNSGVIIDDSGNVGVGVNPSAWYSGYTRAIEIGTAPDNGTIWSSLNQNHSHIGIGANFYIDSSFTPKYKASYAASQYSQSGGSHYWHTAPSGTAGSTITWNNSMTLDASGNLNVGATASYHVFYKAGGNSAGTAALFEIANAGQDTVAQFLSASSFSTSNATGTAVRIGRSSTTSRSISAGGTINASGADYAEYEYSNDITLVKGQIVGFKEDGTLTDKYSEAIRFAIKSTNPSIVGGDTWGIEEIVGKRPEQPVKTEEMSDEEFAKLEEQYEKDLADFEVRLEAERQKVDRIAYAGKVPVNVYGAVAGQYVIAIEKEDGTIDGKLVNKADMTFSEYQDAVGRVNKILDDGRAEVAVIIH